MRPIHLVSVLLLLTLIVTFVAGTLYTILEIKRVRAAHPAAGQFISVEGTRLHYVEQGSGRPVLLLHGNAGFVQDWSAIVPSWRHTTVCSPSTAPAMGSVLAPLRAM